MKHYSYYINYWKNRFKPKVIFIWIPKTAGTSLYKALRQAIGMREYLSLEYAGQSFTNQGAVTFSHIGLNHLLQEGVVKGDFYRKAYVFCVCRNPYDRFISLFYYLKKRNIIPQGHTSLDLMRDIIKGIPPVGNYNVKGLSQCNPQVDWIKNIEIDHVFRFESLNEDIKALEVQLNTSIEMPYFNISKERKKNGEKLDRRTVKLIEEYYKEDFEYFDYSLEYPF